MWVNGCSAIRRGSGAGVRPAVEELITSVNDLRKAIISSGVPTVMRRLLGHAGQMRPTNISFVRECCLHFLAGPAHVEHEAVALRWRRRVALALEPGQRLHAGVADDLLSRR